MIYDHCYGCKYITDRTHPDVQSPCTYCKRRIKIEDNYEKFDEQVKQNIKVEKIPGTEFSNLSTLDNGTRFYVQNGRWIGFVFIKDNKKYMHIDTTNKDLLITGKEDLIIEILPPKYRISIEELVAILKEK